MDGSRHCRPGRTRAADHSADRCAGRGRGVLGRCVLSGSQGARVDESWPTEGVMTSTYSMYKVAEERLLDAVEADHPTGGWCGCGPVWSSARCRQRDYPPLSRSVDTGLVGAASSHSATARGQPAGLSGGARRGCRRGIRTGCPARRARRVQPGKRTGARRADAGQAASREAGSRAGYGVACTRRRKLAPAPATRRGRLARPCSRCPDDGHDSPASSLAGCRRTGDDALLELLDGIRMRDGLPTPPLQRLAVAPARLLEAVRTGASGTRR